jgi:hypothetical protein
MRLALALALALAVTALGANILGEYEFDGWMPLGAGVLFGLAVAEVAVGVGRARGWPLAVALAGMAGAGMWWAARISTAFGLLPMPGEAWAAVVLAGVSAGLRARPMRSSAAGSSPRPAPPA